MKKKTPGNEDSNKNLETVDAVARAAHLWIRALCMTDQVSDGDRFALAGGLISGLCERLDLDPRIQQLVAYVYALLNGQDEDGAALSASRLMVHRPVPPAYRDAYEKGRDEAAGIVEMLAYHRHS